MKTVVMNRTITGLRDGLYWPKRGQEMELPDQEADEMIANGMAVAVADAALVEDENTPMTTGSGKGGK